MPRRFVPSRATSAASRSDRVGVQRRAAIAVALTAVLVLVHSPVVEASVLHGLTIQQLRQRSDAIVSGKVINVRTERRGGRIETIARVRVEQSWRGVDTRTVTVRTLGGQLDGRQLRVAGAAQLRRGDKVLLFLYRSDRDFRPVGMFQGVWHLDRTDLGLARASDPAGASLIRPATGAAAVDLRERTVRQLAGRAGGEQ